MEGRRQDGRSRRRSTTVPPLLLVLLLAVILFGTGLAVRILWWTALAVLVLVPVLRLLGFVMRSTATGGDRGRWYRR
ncbi:hydrophobic protein [Streptomyces sp. QTS137]